MVKFWKNKSIYFTSWPDKGSDLVEPDFKIELIIIIIILKNFVESLPGEWEYDQITEGLQGIWFHT